MLTAQLALLLFVFALPAYADVTIKQQSCGAACTVYQISFEGEINQQARNQLLEAFRDPRVKGAARYYAPLVRLNSPGGSVQDALIIGDALRIGNFTTVVSEGDTCASACVLILSAGVVRIPDSGRVGIHRPRFEEELFASLSPSQARTKYEELARSVQQFLARMGMSEQLYLDMLRVSSDDVRFLSVSEMRSYGLIGHDPAWAEYMRAKQVQSQGLEAYEINRSYFAVLMACYDQPSDKAHACDEEVKQAFERDLELCGMTSGDYVACAKSIEQEMVPRYRGARRR